MAQAGVDVCLLLVSLRQLAFSSQASLAGHKPVGPWQWPPCHSSPRPPFNLGAAGADRSCPLTSGVSIAPAWMRVCLRKSSEKPLPSPHPHLRISSGSAWLALIHPSVSI